MSRIKVIQCHDLFFVWNDEGIAILLELTVLTLIDLVYLDVSKLKVDWKILGTLIGCHHDTIFQSDSLGLPLELTKFETRLLLEHDAIDLYEVCLIAPTSNEKMVMDLKLQESFEEMKHVMIIEKEQTIMKNRDLIIEKAKERKNFAPEISDQQIIEMKLKKCSESITFDKFHPPFFKECPFENRLKQIKFDVEFSSHDECKYQVLRELWLKGYYITPGHKFSCDFLAYEGDPELYHAKYMVVCTESEETSEMEIEMKGRLSVQVNKELLVAHFYSENKKVNFRLVSWRGK